MRRVITILLAAGLLVAGGVSAVALGGNGYGHTTISTITQTTGGGHTPVTICHKPGTPAEQELVVDDDSVELTGHLGHGDTIGPCPTETTPTETTPTDTTPTDTTPTTPTETTPTTPRCPPGQGPFAGKDGNEGNDECCPDSNNDQVCDTTTTTPTPAVVPPSTLTTQSTTTATPPTATTDTPTPAAKSKVKTSSARKTLASKPPKLTGDVKKDKCKPAPGNTLNCKGVIVVPGNG